MILTQRQTGFFHDMLIHGTELSLDCRANGLHGSEAITNLRDMPAEDLVVAMLNHAEEPARPILTRPELLPVGSPHLIQFRSDDRPIMRPRGTIGLRTNR